MRQRSRRATRDRAPTTRSRSASPRGSASTRRSTAEAARRRRSQARRSRFLGWLGEAIDPQVLSPPALAGHAGTAVKMAYVKGGSTVVFASAAAVHPDRDEDVRPPQRLDRDDHRPAPGRRARRFWSAPLLAARPAAPSACCWPCCSSCSRPVGYAPCSSSGRRRAQLGHQALHDALTGLPNRALVLDRAEQMLAALPAPLRPRRRGALRRHRRLQEGQRHLRPRSRRPRARRSSRNGCAAVRASTTPSAGSAATSSSCCSSRRRRRRSPSMRRRAPDRRAPRADRARRTATARSRSPRASASPSASGTPPTSCCATPTSRCTRPRRSARIATSLFEPRMQIAAAGPARARGRPRRRRSSSEQFFLLYQPIFDLATQERARGRGADPLAAPDARPRRRRTSSSRSPRQTG